MSTPIRPLCSLEGRVAQVIIVKRGKANKTPWSLKSHAKLICMLERRRAGD